MTHSPTLCRASAYVLQRRPGFALRACRQVGRRRARHSMKLRRQGTAVVGGVLPRTFAHSNIRHAPALHPTASSPSCHFWRCIKGVASYRHGQSPAQRRRSSRRRTFAWPEGSQSVSGAAVMARSFVRHSAGRTLGAWPQPPSTSQVSASELASASRCTPQHSLLPAGRLAGQM